MAAKSEIPSFSRFLVSAKALYDGSALRLGAGRLFQKEHEQRRRRKSKAQFFEMIQEIRR